MLATIFVGAAVPAGLASVTATLCVAGVCLVGIAVTLLVCRVLSRTVMKGEPSRFFLELPPFRRPAILRVIYRSMIDRTVFVLARACVVAAPAGGFIWLLGNVYIDGTSLMAHLAGWLDPFAWVMGIDGLILVAFLIAIPANEIVVPTLIMGYMAAGQMTELDVTKTGELFRANGWTLMTAVCMMLFSLLHYPCSTTTWTIWRETRSVKWTIWSNLNAAGAGDCGLFGGGGRVAVGQLSRGRTGRGPIPLRTLIQRRRNARNQTAGQERD